MFHLGFMKKLALNLEKSASFDDAMDHLAESAFEAGFSMVDYSYLPIARLSAGDWMAPPLITRGFPPNWDVHWNRHRQNDAYYHACFGGSRMVEWSTVNRSRNLSVSERDSISYLNDKQLVCGLTIPIHLPGTRFAFISGVASSDANLSELQKDQFLYISHYFYRTVSVMFRNPFHGKMGILSAQELEALTWAARGKTAKDISCILRKSPETIRAQLKRAIGKLNAVNCAHAVAKAVYLELIEMEDYRSPVI